MLYFNEKIRTDSVRISQGTYKLPAEIPIEEKMTVEHREPKPLPQRYVSVLRWEASNVKGGVKRYSQSHEINVFIILPKGMDRHDREMALVEMMEDALDTKNYPSLSEILSSWHGSCGPSKDKACWTGVTTTDLQDDGTALQYYMGAVKPNVITVSHKAILKKYGVGVW